MGLIDIFNKNKLQQIETENSELKKQVEELSAKNTELIAKIQPEHHEIVDLVTEKNKLNAEISEINEKILISRNLIAQQQEKCDELKKIVIETQEIALLQSFGIYEPTYDFATSDEYKEELKKIREEGKALINDDKALTVHHGWSLEGSVAAGNKLANDIAKLLMRAFNLECDELISKVKYNNYDTYKKRIEKSFNAINKYGKMMCISINGVYKNNKIKELTLAFEYAQKKHQEKEEQKELRARMREEAITV